MRYRHPNASMYADKILVKDFVSEVIGNEAIIPTLGKWRNADNIEFDRLPESFILKSNHASAWNIFVTNKQTIDIPSVRSKLNKFLSINYYNIGREYQYRDITPHILAEPLLTSADGSPLLDYKFFCFQGSPQFIQVDFDRQTNHTRNFYDLEWQKMPFNILYPPHIGDPKKPANLDKMIAIARRLAQGFPFIRVDLYEIDGHVYFGELTFHPEGGFGPITPDEWDVKLGKMLVLPSVAS